MKETTIPALLTLIWGIFIALSYYSVFRSPAGNTRKKQGGPSIQKAPPLSSVVAILLAALVVRVALTFTSGDIVDISSSVASWWNTLIYTDLGSFAKVIAKLPSILADLFSAWILFKIATKSQVIPKTLVLSVISLWAFNPYSLFTSASSVQTVSIAFALLFGSIYLLENKSTLSFLLGGLLAGLAVFFHSFAIYFVVLLLIYVFFSAKESKNLFLSLILFILSAGVIYLLGTILMGDHYVLLFPAANSDILSYPTLNAFNFYTFMDSWKESWYSVGSFHADSKFFFLTVRSFGYAMSALSVLITAILYVRSGKKSNFYFYGGLLTLLIYTFTSAMTPFMILPVVFFFYADYILHKSSGSLILGFLSSIYGLLNISVVSLRLVSINQTQIHGTDTIAFIGSLLLVATLVMAFYFAVSEHAKVKEGKEPFVFQPLELGKTQKMLKLDWVLLAVFTIVALFSNFWQLGDMSAPSSVWKATEGKETVVEVDGTPTHMSYFLSLGATGQALQVELDVKTSDDGVTWENLKTVSESGYSYTWYDTSLMNTKRFIKVSLNADHMQVLEIGFYDSERNLLPVRVVSGPSGAFDEQTLAQYGRNYKNSMYFDEVYHGRTAYEVTEHINEYEWTHPPLGKLIMSLGIRLFGMNPFGWRAAGAFFGALLVPLMYLFGKNLFARTLPAAGMAFLMLFDNFRFAQTRIGTIDTYGVFFIILMYYFMYDFYSMNFKEVTSFKEIWRPLLLSGIFMGVGCAAKWIGFYAAAGLAILFFMAFYRFSKENKKLFGQYSSKIIGLCFIFFGLIPFLIYYASYLPHLSLFDYKFSEFIHQQNSMYSYHANLESTHAYSSSWYMWPFMIRPVYMSAGGSGIAPGYMARIGGIGNPVIWWALLPALVAFIFLACKKMKDHRFSFLIIGFLAQYLSWVLIARTTYQYHFFASLPFLFAMLLYVLVWLKDNYRAKPLLYIYGALVILAFIAIFPAVSGMELPSSSKWFDMIKAFDTWNYL